MKWVYRFGIAVGALVIAFFVVCGGGGMLLSGNISLATTRHVAASPSGVHPFLTTHSGVSEWWVLAARSAPVDMPPPTISHTAGPGEGPGLQVAFEADGMALETWILKSEDVETVVWDVDFGVVVVERTFTLMPHPSGGTLVGWTEKGKIDNPFLRWMAVAMPPEEIVHNFDIALEALDEVSAPAERPVPQ